MAQYRSVANAWITVVETTAYLARAENSPRQNEMRWRAWSRRSNTHMGGNEMARKTFEAIAEGLEDALAHARGKRGRGRIGRVRVPEVEVGAIRAKLGLSQEDFAAAFGVSVGTVRNWEQGRRQPDGPPARSWWSSAKRPGQSCKLSE